VNRNKHFGVPGRDRWAGTAAWRQGVDRGDRLSGLVCLAGALLWLGINSTESW